MITYNGIVVTCASGAWVAPAQPPEAVGDEAQPTAINPLQDGDSTASTAPELNQGANNGSTY